MKNDSKLKFLFLLFYMLTTLTSGLESEDTKKNPFSALSGGDTLQITLQDAIYLALEHNPTVTIQRLEPEIIQTVANEQRAVFDPEISASANKSQTKILRFLGSRPDPFEMQSDRFQYDLAISETLPTGTMISANASLIGSISSIYTDQFSGNIGLTVTQALLQGFGVGANLANLRKANIDVDISEAELKAVAEQLVADVENAYWDCYLAKEEVKIQRKSLELAERQLSESLERVAVGKLPDLELAAVHAEVATRQIALIDAQSRCEQTRLRLLYLLNPSTESYWSMLTLLADEPLFPLDSLDDISVHEQLGMKYRPDLRQANLALKIGELDIQRTKNGLLPRLDLFITLARTSYAKTFREAMPDLQSPFYDVSAGLSFVVPVPNRKARAERARAKWSQQQMELALNNMKRLVQWDVRSAYIEVLRSRQQIKATRVTRELQEQKLAAEAEKFRVGKSTNFLVLQAQRDFTASQLDEARSMVSYLNALVHLYLMEGSLLERRGIKTLFE